MFMSYYLDKEKPQYPIRPATNHDIISCAVKKPGLRIGVFVYIPDSQNPQRLVMVRISNTDLLSSWSERLEKKEVFAIDLWDQINSRPGDQLFYWAFSMDLNSQMNNHPIDRLDPWGRPILSSAVSCPPIEGFFLSYVVCFVDSPTGQRTMLIIADDRKIAVKERPSAIEVRIAISVILDSMDPNLLYLEESKIEQK